MHRGVRNRLKASKFGLKANKANKKKRKNLHILFLLKGLQGNPFYRKFCFILKEGILNISRKFLELSVSVYFQFLKEKKEDSNFTNNIVLKVAR